MKKLGLILMILVSLLASACTSQPDANDDIFPEVSTLSAAQGTPVRTVIPSMKSALSGKTLPAQAVPTAEASQNNSEQEQQDKRRSEDEHSSSRSDDDGILVIDASQYVPEAETPPSSSGSSHSSSGGSHSSSGGSHSSGSSSGGSGNSSNPGSGSSSGESQGGHIQTGGAGGVNETPTIPFA